MSRTAIALFCTLACMAAQADEPASFALELSRDEIPLSDGSRLDVDGLGFRYSEGSALPLRLELSLGREGVVHTGDSLSTGFQPSGYYGGITLGAAAPRWRALQIGANLSYSYHAANQQFNLQQLEIDWRHAEARGWLALQLNERVKLYGCAVTVNIDGTQTINGGTPSQLDINNQQHSGYCGGIELEVGNGGYIGLEAESRYQHGGRLYFGRRYLF